jgi:hypothetical protein
VPWAYPTRPHFALLNFFSIFERIFSRVSPLFPSPFYSGGNAFMLGLSELLALASAHPPAACCGVVLI